MFTGGFDYKTATGLHEDRLNEAKSIRRAKSAIKNKRTVKTLRYKIGKQLITMGEKMIA